MINQAAWKKYVSFLISKYVKSRFYGVYGIASYFTEIKVFYVVFGIDVEFIVQDLYLNFTLTAA